MFYTFYYKSNQTNNSLMTTAFAIRTTLNIYSSSIMYNSSYYFSLKCIIVYSKLNYNCVYDIFYSTIFLLQLKNTLIIIYFFIGVCSSVSVALSSVGIDRPSFSATDLQLMKANLCLDLQRTWKSR